MTKKFVLILFSTILTIIQTGCLVVSNEHYIGKINQIKKGTVIVPVKLSDRSPFWQTHFQASAKAVNLSNIPVKVRVKNCGVRDVRLWYFRGFQGIIKPGSSVVAYKGNLEILSGDSTFTSNQFLTSTDHSTQNLEFAITFYKDCPTNDGLRVWSYFADGP